MDKLKIAGALVAIFALAALAILVIWPSASLLIAASQAGLDKFTSAYTLVVKETLVGLADKLLVAAIAWVAGAQVAKAIKIFRQSSSN